MEHRGPIEACIRLVRKEDGLGFLAFFFFFLVNACSELLGKLGDLMCGIFESDGEVNCEGK